MLPPELSVLIPVRNAAATVDQALGSIKAQTFRNWEALVVDDGSTDETPRLLASWGRRDHRFRIIRNAERGLVPALNAALVAARAPLIARMDADDVCLPRRFELQMRRLDEGDAAAVGCHVRYFPDEAVAGGARRYEEWLNELVTPEEHDRDIFIECPVAHPTLMLRADVLRDLGGYQDRGWPEDYDLVLRLWEAGHQMAKVPEPLFLWREQPERTSRTDPAYAEKAFIRCKVHYLRRTVLSDGRPPVIFGAGPLGKAFARALVLEGMEIRAFVDVDPKKVGAELYGARVLPQEETAALHGEGYGLVALGQPGARQRARELLRSAGWTECRDFRCVA